MVCQKEDLSNGFDETENPCISFQSRGNMPMERERLETSEKVRLKRMYKFRKGYPFL